MEKKEEKEIFMQGNQSVSELSGGNVTFDMKKCRKDFSRLGFAFILGTVAIYAVQFLTGVIVGLVNVEWLYDVNISLILSAVPMYLIGMPILILLVKRLPATQLEKRHMKTSHFFIAGIMVFAIMYLSNIVGNVLTSIIGALKGSMVENTIAEIAASSNLLLTFVLMVLCAPVIEEYIFRKLIVDRTIRYGQGVAVFLSGFMFGLFHGNLSQFAYAFTIGLFLAFLYAKTGNLKITILLHMIINFMGSTVSVLILKAANLEEFTDIANSGASTEELMAVMMNSLSGWIAYMIYALIIFACMIAGVVLLIAFHSKFKLSKGEIVIPSGKRFRTVLFNPGMLLYCIFWGIMIVVQLFA